MTDWTTFLTAMTLALVRVSGMVAFAPFFSSAALPIRVKAVFVGAVAYLLGPLVAALPGTRVSIGLSALLGELAVGLVYGLTLTLLNEMLLFAGQIAGVQFSFSLVNLLDPASSIQTPLMSELFQLMGTLALIASCWPRWCAVFTWLRWVRSLWRHRALWPLRAQREESFWRQLSWPRRCLPLPCWSRSLCL